MKDVIVVIGGGLIGQAIARRIGSGRHVLLADVRQENAEAELNIALVAFSPPADRFLAGRQATGAQFDAATDYRSHRPQYSDEGIDRDRIDATLTELPKPMVFGGSAATR